MFNPKSVISLLCDNPVYIEEVEDFSLYRICIKTNSTHLKDQQQFEQVIASFRGYNDTGLLSVEIDGETRISEKILDINYEKLAEKLALIEGIKETDSEYIISVHIEKNSIKRNLCIYNATSLYEYISSITLQNLLLQFGKIIFAERKYIWFVNDKVEDSTAAFYLTSHERELDDVDDLFQSANFENKEFCHCRLSRGTILTPEFYRTHNETQNPLCDTLNKLALISAICHLFSYVEIEGDSLQIKFNGYKTIAGIIDWKQIQNYSLVLVDVYRWVFSGNNIEDKLGIFRNILSLNITNMSEILLLNRETFESMLSSHEIYLKANVNQYIQVKSLFIEHHINLLSNMNKLSDTLSDSLKSNFIAFITFFVSVVVLNSISTGKIDNIFNNTIYVISSALIIISFLQLVLNIFEIILKWKRQKAAILSTKKEYEDVLNKNDIENIFTKSINIESARKNLIQAVAILASIWLLSLLVLLVSTSYLNSIHIEEEQELKHVVNAL